MAKKSVTTTEWISDISGEQAVETLYFTHTNRALEIDVTADELDDFTKLMQKYVDKARPDSRGEGNPSKRVSSRGRGPNRSQEERDADARKASDKKSQRAEIIAWAVANPSSLYKTPGDRGKINSNLIDAFYKANSDAERLY